MKFKILNVTTKYRPVLFPSVLSRQILMRMSLFVCIFNEFEPPVNAVGPDYQTENHAWLRSDHLLLVSGKVPRQGPHSQRHFPPTVSSVLEFLETTLTVIGKSKYD